MLNWIDYLVIAVPVLFVIWMAWYVRRYIKSVTDFLSVGRLCGRYLITVGDVANALSIIGLLGYVEVHYKTGFALSFWSGIVAPISLVLGLTGFCNYRFRATKAMSIGQFVEMRYSRGLRVFASGLRSVSEMLANMIMPALAARFFIYFLDLPKSFQLFGITFSTFHVVMFIGICFAISIILMGGMVSIVVTDSLQGLMLYPLVIFFIIFILCKFSWSNQISVVMMDRVAGESFINPMDIHKLRDFNFLMTGIGILGIFLHRASWFASGSTVAKTPHEQKMAAILGSWRQCIVSVFYVLIAIGVITVLNHKDFSKEAKVIRNDIVTRVANDIVKDDAVRNNIIDAAAAIPAHNHTFRKDPPMSDKQNLDTPYLDAAKGVLAKEKGGMGIYAQFRSLYFQTMATLSMRHMLPHGMLGAFALLMILAMISTDDSRIYSASVTITQDVILPYKRTALKPSQHVWLIRWVSVGVGVFFLFASSFMAQLDYIQMFVTITTSLWLGGCGPVLVFGLYSRFGTTAGAWASLLSGAGISLVGALLQRNWADIVYPWLKGKDLVEPIGKFFEVVSRPMNPVVVWEMKPERFPVNSYEIYAFALLVSLALYCIVSKCTMKEPFNLDRMLHRGAYAEPGSRPPEKRDWSPRGILRSMVGITNEYTKMDKFVAWGMFAYSFVYAFLIMFVLTLIVNTKSPWSAKIWSNYYGIQLLVVPGIIAFITTFWFGIGGVRDMFALFRDLKTREINVLDDGRVEGNVSLADKAKFEEIEKAANETNSNSDSKASSGESSGSEPQK